MTTPDLTIISSRAPVLVELPDGTRHRDAALYLGTVPGEPADTGPQPRCLVYVRPGRLVFDETWDPDASMGMPGHGSIWQVATSGGPVKVTPTRGCVSCGGAWFRNFAPFPDQRGPTLRRFLDQRGVG